MVSNRSNRNSTIEFTRFFFACTIMATHYYFANSRDGILNCDHGDIGVEFFFLLSGLLMAQSASKLIGKVTKDNAGTITGTFIIKKIRSFLPYLLLASIIPFVLTFMWELDLDRAICEFVNAVPYYGMAQSLGMTVWTYLNIGVTWYLSAMVIGLLILYPLYLMFNDISRRIVFPLLAMICLGCLEQNYGSILGTTEWAGFVTTGLIRGIGEMALGVVCYDVCLYLKKIDFRVPGKVLMSVLEIFLIVFIVVYVKGWIVNLHALTALTAIAVILVLMYSRVGVWHVPVGNRLCSFLGAISLPLYLIHLPLLRVMAYFYGWDFALDNLPLMMALSVAMSILTYYVVNYLSAHKEVVLGVFRNPAKPEE